VDKDFSSNVEAEMAVREDEPIETQAAAKASAIDKLRERQIKWLGRAAEAGSAAADKATWRPQKRYRAAGKRWLHHVDRQLTFSLGPDQGLSKFVPCPSWGKDAKLWPLLTVAMDQGSDGVAAMHWMQRCKRMNVEEVFDFSHNAWNDFKGTVKDCGLWDFFLMFLITVNVVHGPWGEDQRYQAVRDGVADCWKHLTPESCPLFQDYHARILQEHGLSEELGLQTAAQDLWKKLGCTKMSFDKKGYKCNLNRYFHAFTEGADLCRNWTSRLFAYTYCALETDIISSVGVRKLVFKETPAHLEARQTTSSSIMATEEKALKKSCTNALTMACLFLSDDCRRMVLFCMTVIARPLHKWYQEHSSKCRRAVGNAAWLTGQICGKYMVHLHAILQAALSDSGLAEMGFWLPGGPAPVTSLGEDGKVIMEDEAADVAGKFGLNLVANRLTRGLYLLEGWPSKVYKAFASTQQAADTIQQLKHDWECYSRLKAAYYNSYIYIGSCQASLV
jgi:hypothetical protein